MEPVTYERVGAAAILTIDRQERRNAIDGPTAALLGEAYQAFATDDEARVLVITGAGGVAQRGRGPQGDRELRAAHGRPQRPARREPRDLPQAHDRRDLGLVPGGWLELALWCDLRIATEGSSLGFPERRWGVPLVDGGTQRLPRIVGLGRALDLILTGRIIDAREALDMGPSPSWSLWAAMSTSARDGRGARPLPQDTMLADRRAAIEGIGLTLRGGPRSRGPEQRATQETAWRGAARFAGGEGRGGAGAGV